MWLIYKDILSLIKSTSYMKNSSTYMCMWVLYYGILSLFIVLQISISKLKLCIFYWVKLSGNFASLVTIKEELIISYIVDFRS